MSDLARLSEAREDAMKKVRAWWDAEILAYRQRHVTDAPAWPEYLAAFDALDKARTEEP